MLLNLDQFLPKKEETSSTIVPEAIWTIESGGRQFTSDNKVVTSRTGALGVGQIQPTTGPEAAALAGVEWNPWSLAYDEDYNKTLSKAYLKKKQEDFAGDELKGVAAYNAGTAGVQRAIDKADKEGGSWRDYLPEETKNYIVRYQSVKSKGAKAAEPTQAPKSNLIDVSQYLPKDNIIDVAKFLPPVEEEQQTQLETFASQAAKNLAPAGAFFAGGSALAAVGAPAAAFTGPAAPFVEGALFLTGGVAASLGVDKLQEMLLPEQTKNYLALGEKQNKYTALAGQLASFAPYTKLGLAKKVVEGVSVVDKPMAAALAGAGGGIDAAAQYITTGTVDPIQVAMNTVATPFLGQGMSKLGKAVSVERPAKVYSPAEIQNREVADTTIDTMNRIDLRNVEAGLEEENLRKLVIEGSPIDETAEITAAKLKDLFVASGRKSDGTKVEAGKDHLIFSDEEAFAWRENKLKYLNDLENKIAERTRVLSDPNVTLTEPARLKLQSELDGFVRSKENNLYILEKQQKLGSTEYLLPVLNRVRDIYDELGKKGVETGVLNGMLNNYIPSIVDSSQSSLGAEGLAQALENFYRLKVESFKTDSSMDRMFNTAKDLQAYLNTIDPKLYVHTDIATVTGAYMKSMNKAIAQKELINFLENTAVVGSNKGIIIEDAAAAMRDNYVSYTSKGAGLLEGKFVHPDYAPIIDQMFQRRDIGAIKNAFVQTAMLTKALNVVGSLFHAPSLGWAMAGASPKLIFKEIITAGSGIRRAVKDLESGELSEYTKLAIETGTKIGTEDVQRSVVADFGAYVDKKLFAGNKALGRVTGPLDKYVLQKMNTFTWDYMHTGGKLALFEDLMKKAERNLKEVPGTEEYTKARFALAKRISNSVNFTMGGLQWLQAANSIKSSLNRQLALHGTGIESRAWGQVAMFAPDWTVSTLGSFLKGMPSSLDIKGGLKGVMSPMNETDLSRRYMINTGLLYLTLLDAINLGTSGQHIWQNEDPTRIQHADGTTQQLAKHSMEFFHWLIDPAKTFKAKLGFVPKAGLALLDDQGGDYFQRAGTILKLAAPFSVGSAMQAPEGEEIKRFVSSSAGFPVYGKPDAYLRDPTDVLTEKTERKLVRRENQLERVEEIQRKAERSQMRGLFEDFF